MKFEKGNTLGSGRPKGASNKETKQLREFIASVLEDNYDKFMTELEKLEGKAFLDVIGNFMEYKEAKLSRIEVKAEVENTTRRIGFDEKE